MNNRRFLRALALATAAMTAGGIITAAPARASSCYGYSCHGLDPVKASCPVSSTTTTYGAYATVWNRYSYACNANWVRAQLTPAAISAGYQWIIVITTIDSKGQSERMCYPWNDNTGYLDEQCSDRMDVPINGYEQAAWSDMVDGTNVTSADVIIYKDHTSSWPYEAIAQYEARQ
jgi:hypothetical protein